jgi:hypothetical protein
VIKPLPRFEQPCVHYLIELRPLRLSLLGLGGIEVERFAIFVDRAPGEPLSHCLANIG